MSGVEWKHIGSVWIYGLGHLFAPLVAALHKECYRCVRYVLSFAGFPILIYKINLNSLFKKKKTLQTWPVSTSVMSFHWDFFFLFVDKFLFLFLFSYLEFFLSSDPPQLLLNFFYLCSLIAHRSKCKTEPPPMHLRELFQGKAFSDRRHLSWQT